MSQICPVWCHSGPLGVTIGHPCSEPPGLSAIVMCEHPIMFMYPLEEFSYFPQSSNVFLRHMNIFHNTMTYTYNTVESFPKLIHYTHGHISASKIHIIIEVNGPVQSDLVEKIQRFIDESYTLHTYGI